MGGNSLRGQAAFTARNREFLLTYDINALVLAEDAAGMPIADLITALDRGASLKVIRAVVWAGLQAKYECHLIEAGELMTEAGIPAVNDAMRKALASGFPTPSTEAAVGRNPRKATSGTGSAG